MNIDRGSFLILVSTLAIGAAGGYVAAEKRLFPALDKWRGRPPEPGPEPPRPLPIADTAPAVSAPPPPPPAPPAAPACDDAVAVAPLGDCPPPGYPTIEGGCGSFANIRCGEMKQAYKPRVAQAAVACLNKLSPQERCDAARVNLCGHLALTNACPEHDADAGAGTGAGGRTASVICQGIMDACGASPIAPTMTECRLLLSGMNDTGRERARSCMKSHCFDRGLVGCEGVTSVK